MDLSKIKNADSQLEIYKLKKSLTESKNQIKDEQQKKT